MPKLIRKTARSSTTKSIFIEVITPEIIDFIIESVDLRMKNSHESDVIENCVDLKRELKAMQEED